MTQFSIQQWQQQHFFTTWASPAIGSSIDNLYGNPNLSLFHIANVGQHLFALGLFGACALIILALRAKRRALGRLRSTDRSSRYLVDNDSDVSRERQRVLTSRSTTPSSSSSSTSSDVLHLVELTKRWSRISAPLV